MPRLNIELSLYTDNRFQSLLIKLGDRHKAMGMCLDAFILAQNYWIPDMKLIPKEAFLNSSLGFILDVGLAKETEEGIYVRGTKANFQWYFDGIQQRVEAGKKSAESRKKKFGSSVPINATNNPNESRTLVRNPFGSNPNETEPSPLLFSSLKKIHIPAKAGKCEIKEKSPVHKLYEYFHKLYENKHNSKYVPNYKKDCSIIKTLLKIMPEIEIAFYMEKFFEIEDDFISKTSYEVGIFKTQINKLKLTFPYHQEKENNA